MHAEAVNGTHVDICISCWFQYEKSLSQAAEGLHRDVQYLDSRIADGT